jgi:predicted permease
MMQAFAIVAPLILLVAFGLAGARTRLLGTRMGDGLNDFVSIVAVPALLFRTLATAQFPAVPPWGYWIAYFIGVGTIWMLAMLAARRLFAQSGQDAAMAGFATGQANTVLVGIPLILRSFGDQAMLPIGLLLAIHLPITMTTATLLVERSNGNVSALGLLKRLFTHPIIIGILLGLLVKASGLPLPEPVHAAAKLLGDAAAPAALLALGMALNRYGLGAAPGLLAIIAALKLVVHPAIVYVLGVHVFALPPLWAAVALLFAACPSGINAYLLAERYRTGVALTSGTVSVTTVGAVLTVPIWVWVAVGLVR